MEEGRGKKEEGRRKVSYAAFGFFLVFLLPLSVSAQSWMDEVKDSVVTEYVKASFKSTRVINAHSLENLAEGVLDFRIMHRFSPINSGAQNLFGLDFAQTRLQFDYGIKDWLQAGIGRSGNNKIISGYGKWKFIRQSTGAKNMPLSVIYVAGVDFDPKHYDVPDSGEVYHISNRFSFLHQLIIGRKFSESFSAEILPTLIHRNLVTRKIDQNDIWAGGVGLRQKISKRVAINLEYFYVLRKQDAQEPATGLLYRNPISLGFDIETGGHVFQLHLANTQLMNENGFIAENTGNWLKGDIYFGFNISRVFTMYRKGWK